jgi:hypothetical protein
MKGAARMKNLILTFYVSFLTMAAHADKAQNLQLLEFQKDKQNYLENKCVINSVSLWFVHSCKDIAWEAGSILEARGYHFNGARVDVTLGGPMKTVVVSARISSISNPTLSSEIDAKDMVGKIVSYNVTDKSGSQYLVLSEVNPNLDLNTISSIRIGKQGKTKDFFCHNSYIMARAYLDELRRLPHCKTVIGQNDL